LAGRLAIDFGTANTRAAVWNPETRQARMLDLPEISVTRSYRTEDDVEHTARCVPSLINYSGDRLLIGRQVLDQGLGNADTTFQRMKRYIATRREQPRHVNGKTVTFPKAGADFLAGVLDYALAEGEVARDEEIGFTVPVESYEHFQGWLARVCEDIQVRRYRLLDEASAAALGYDVGARPDDAYLVFDHGAYSLDIAVVRLQLEPGCDKRCRVLGKAGADLGGSIIEDWMYQDVLARNGRRDTEVRHLSARLMAEISRVKEALSQESSASAAVSDPGTGAEIRVEFTRPQFETLLKRNRLFDRIEAALDHALRRAREYGYDRDSIRAVIQTGGTSLIPCVRNYLRESFGDRVRYHRPLEAVALGGAAFVGGVELLPHIQHDYALHGYKREKGDYDFETIAPAGTPYPTPPGQAIYERTVSANVDNLEYLGLNIYELGRDQRAGTGSEIEIVFDADGCARLTQCRSPEIASHFWMNEKHPTFIHAQPPARKGEAPFLVRFAIDGNKQLCLTVVDKRTDRTLMQDFPVVRLT
jgi:molecular chaperone DnaK (HSP70)